MINYDLFKEIELYANRHVESSKDYYLSRNQNPDKMFIQIFRGKIAEYCCYFSMKQAGYILENEPDLKIYSEANKSYDADLICIGKNNKLYDVERHIHIKSVSRKNFLAFGASFLVQKNDRIVSHPQDNHYYSVMLEQSLTHYTFYAWLNSCEVNYQPPKNSNLYSKLAVYIE